MRIHEFFLRLLPKKIVSASHEMGDTYQRIGLWSGCLHGMILVMIGIGIGSIVVLESFVLFFVLGVLSCILRMLILRRVLLAYKAYCEKRNTEFLYFFTLVIPYLKGGSKTGLYRILTQLEKRLDDQSILRKGVNRLMFQMTNNPGSMQPFLDFAQRCSGSQLAEDVAIALFDFQQSQYDEQAIDRLKDKVNRALQKRIEEIVDMKCARFRWYSTRVVMSVFVLVLGILGTSIWVEIEKAFSLI